MWWYRGLATCWNCPAILFPLGEAGNGHLIPTLSPGDGRAYGVSKVAWGDRLTHVWMGTHGTRP